MLLCDSKAPKLCFPYNDFDVVTTKINVGFVNVWLKVISLLIPIDTCRDLPHDGTKKENERGVF